MDLLADTLPGDEASSGYVYSFIGPPIAFHAQWTALHARRVEGGFAARDGDQHEAHHDEAHSRRRVSVGTLETFIADQDGHHNYCQ